MSDSTMIFLIILFPKVVLYDNTTCRKAHEDNGNHQSIPTGFQLFPGWSGQPADPAPTGMQHALSMVLQPGRYGYRRYTDH